MRVAALQMTSGAEVAANLAQAASLLEEAAASGARLAVLPENFSFLGLKDADKRAVAEADGAGPVQEFLAASARRLAEVEKIAEAEPEFVKAVRLLPKSAEAQYGLGYVINTSYMMVRYPTIVIGMVTLGFVGYATSALVRIAGDYLMEWRVRELALAER